MTRVYTREWYRRKRQYGLRNDKYVIFVVFILFLGILLGNYIGLFMKSNKKKSDVALQKGIVLEGYSGQDKQQSSVSNIKLLPELIIEQLGKPYVYGDEGPDSFDCSGLIQYVYSQINIILPRTVAEQAEIGVPVEKEELKFGDIVFFSNDSVNPTHAGIYVGKGYFVHAPKSGDVVKVESLDMAYYKERYKGAVRVYVS